MKTHQAQSYKKIIKLAQFELPVTERILSKIIHTSPLWKTGQLLENVLARRTPLIIGYILSIVFGVILLGIAFVFNYHIESLHIVFFTFAIGYIIGLVIDYIKLLSKQQ